MAPFSNQDQAVFVFDDDDSDVSSIVLTKQESSSSLSTATPSSPLSTVGRRRPRAKRSVSFSSDIASTYDVLHIHDFSLMERRHSWYTLGEMLLIRQDWKDVVAEMEKNTRNSSKGDTPTSAAPLHEATTCTRGLEGKTRHGKESRKACRSSSWGVVLDEQAFQDMDGTYDPLMIAMAYSDATFLNQIEAFQRAIWDRDEARAICGLAPLVDEDEKAQTKGPTKFDFESVRSMYLFNADDDDMTVMTEDRLARRGGLQSSSGSFLGLNLRGKIACFLPMTPKRYRRKVRKVSQ
jgi:hypothetical protein